MPTVSSTAVENGGGGGGGGGGGSGGNDIETVETQKEGRCEIGDKEKKTDKKGIGSKRKERLVGGCSVLSMALEQE